MSPDLSIQGSPSPTVVTQQMPTPGPNTSRNVILATTVVSAIILVVGAIFLDYIVKNYTDSHGGFTNDTAQGLFVGCLVGVVAAGHAFPASIICLFIDRVDPVPNQQEAVR